MSLSLVAGTTSKSIGVFIKHSTTGQGLTGLAFDTASLVAYWFQPRIAGATAITLATLSNPTVAWSSGGFVEISSANMPGWYRLDIPNAALTGATSVCIELKGAANMLDKEIEIELTAVNNQDAVRGGMTALPNAVPGAAGGVFIAGSNASTLVAALSVTGDVEIGGMLDITSSLLVGGAFTVSGTTTLSISGFTLTQIGEAVRDTDYTSTVSDTLGGFVAPAGIRAAVGLASANLDTQLANILGTGAGSFPITVTVVDGSAVAIQNALVWISDGVTAISQQTNASGHATYSLNAATYTVAITKAGYSFTPTTRTVTGSQTGTLVNNLVMTAVNVPPSPPANPAKGTIYGNVVRSDGASPTGIVITATLMNSSGQPHAVSVGGNMLAPVIHQTNPDGNGDWEIDLFGNDDITPVGTYWLVVVLAANFSARVDLDGGQVLNIDNLIV